MKLKQRIVGCGLSALVLCLSSVALADGDAPTPAKPPLQTKFQLTVANIRALALVGSAFEKTASAKSYRGRVVVEKQRLKPGDTSGTPQSIRVEQSSGWKTAEGNQPATYFLLAQYRVAEGRQLQIVRDELFEQHNNGTVDRSFYHSQKAWSEKPAVAESDPAGRMLAQFPVVMVSMAIYSGYNFILGEEVREGRMVRTIRGADGAFFVAVDKESGAFVEFRVKSATEDMRLQWFDQSFNEPIPAWLFEWKLPAEAKQVPADSIKLDIQL